ncbi:21674_t:CDS:1, partial [Racocetra persica]
MVNAFPSQLVKRQTSFGRCPPLFPQDIQIITDVTLNPDPPKANSQLEVKGSATINDDIVDGYVFKARICDTDFAKCQYLSTILICETTQCPTKVFNFDVIFNLESLPSSYTIG